MSPPNSSSLQHAKRRKLSAANLGDASEDDSANIPSAKASIGDDDSDNNNLNNAANLPSNNNGASLVDDNNIGNNDIHANNTNSTAATTCGAYDNHHIQQTLVGLVCTHNKCQSKIGRNQTKLFVSDDTIRDHWNKNKCYEGSEVPNASQVEKDQELHLVSIHERIKLSPSRGEEIVNETFPPDECTISNRAYCCRCGFHDAPARVKKHLDAKSNNCGVIHFRQKGIIVTNKYGQSMPQALLQSMAASTFNFWQLLPPSKKSSPISPPRTSPVTNNSLTNGTSTINNSSTPPSASSSEPMIFPASPEEMEKACSSHHTPQLVEDSGKFSLEIIECFGSDASAEAMKHGSMFIPLSTSQPNASLKGILTNLAHNQKPERNPDTTLRVLLKAGNRWLKSDSANMDVNSLSADIRNNVFLVGTNIPDSSRDLLRGDTFVATDNTDDLSTVFNTFLTFVYKTAPPNLIKPYTSDAEAIYNSVREDMSENEREQAAAARIVDTTIIPGLLSTILLQHPTTTNGSNLVGDFMAGATVKINASNKLSIRNPNEISRGANALQRLLRHGICSMLCRKSNSINEDAAFREWARPILISMQRSYSMDIISRRMRSAMFPFWY